MNKLSLCACGALLSVNITYAGSKIDLPVVNQILNPGAEYKVEISNLSGYTYNITCAITSEQEGHIIYAAAMVLADPQMPSGVSASEMKLNGKNAAGNVKLVMGSNTLLFPQAYITAASPRLEFKNFDTEKTVTIDSCSAEPFTRN
jgi:hypothetical protein